MTLWDQTASTVTGSAFGETHRVVVIHDGRRGTVGPEGDSVVGPPGDSITVLGGWVKGTTYGPLDAVSWRSVVADNIQSLYVQRSSVPASVSDTAPNLAPDRWEQIGAIDWDNSFGGIWNVQQFQHGFTKVGQPVGYSFQADRYVLADCRRNDELAIGVVREVVNANRVILQSSGEVPDIDPDIIWPAGSDWEPGRVYYVASVRGYVSLTPPADPGYYTNPILIPSDVDGSRNGIALPWTPTGGPGTVEYVPVGKQKFYFTIDEFAERVAISGPDDDGNVLSYVPGPNTDVFVNGLNLSDRTQYTADDGATILFDPSLVNGDYVEVWTPDRPLDLLVPSTAVKLDSIEGLFDGVATEFPLTLGAAAVAIQASTNVMLWVDAVAQEALVDYTLETRAGSGTDAFIVFSGPVPAGSRFWGLLFAPTP